MDKKNMDNLGVTEDFLKDAERLTQEAEGSEETEAGEEAQTEGSEEGSAEGEAEDGGEEGSGDKVKPYTDEELLTILDGDGKLDSNRLTPAQKLIQRSFARHAEKGYQEIAKMKRDLESVKERTTQTQPRTIEEAFDQNPREVLDWIDGQLAMIANDVDKDPINALKQVANLQATRNRLTDRQVQNNETRRSQRDTYESVVREITEAIPDLEGKQAKLTEFAINELGYTDEELAKMTNPSMGKIAVNTVKTINAAYEAKYGKKEKTAESTAKKKVVKMPIVEGAQKKDGTSVNPDAVKMRKAVEAAKKTGDWTEVLNLKGVLPKIAER